MQIIEAFDYPLFFFYGLIFFAFTRRILRKHLTAQEYKWFLTSWFIKMAACLAYAWMIVYYYGYGDPIGYYQLSGMLRKAILDDPGNLLYLFQSGKAFKTVAHLYTQNPGQYLLFGYFDIEGNFIVHKTACLFSFITFNRFLIIAFLFANVSFWGFFALYKGLTKLFPVHSKNIALSALFIPSCIFWTSGLAKEPICLLCEGILFYCAADFIVNRTLGLKRLFWIASASYILYVVKNYIFICLAAGLFFWFLYNVIDRVSKKQPLLKFGFFLMLFFILAVQIFLLWDSVQAIMVDNLAETVNTNLSIYNNIYNNEAGGSLIEVSSFDVSNPSSVVAFLPTAVGNVFFRPWPWEIANPLMVLTVLENLFFLVLFIRTLVYTRLFTRGASLVKNFQVFIFVFSLSLALIVGISTFNFGTLVRYRIPFLPFWVLYLLMKGVKNKENPRINNLITG